MRHSFLYLCMATVLVLASCKPAHDPLVEDITNREARLMDVSLLADEAFADSLLDLYQQFVEAYPEDSLAPIYLFRSADVLLNINRTEQAIEKLDDIIANYGDFEEIGTCYFMRGLAYEQNGQVDEAKQAYEEYLSKFPDHYLAADTRSMLPYIGLSPEQMLEVVMNEADSAAVPAVTEM